MQRSSNLIIASLALLFSLAFSVPTLANDNAYNEAVTNFKKANESRHFFNTAYGYAIFPTVAKGGIGMAPPMVTGEYTRAVPTWVIQP